jgi:hypothetical protein
MYALGIYICYPTTMNERVLSFCVTGHFLDSITYTTFSQTDSNDAKLDSLVIPKIPLDAQSNWD